MLTARIKKAINAHANECHPREACGVIADGKYIPCTNVSPDDTQFEIDVMDLVSASKQGKIQAYVHSHSGFGEASTKPSQPDMIQMGLHGLPWVIANGVDVDLYKPTNYKAPLLGREYHHGLLDCYTLFRDYYERELDIILSEYERKDEWWEDSNHPSLYLDNFAAEGFVEVSKDELQKHDVLLCRIGRTNHVNHAAIYLGDGKLTSEEAPPVFGDNIIIHHPYGRDSLREIFGRQWYDRTSIVIRHRSLL